MNRGLIQGIELTSFGSHVQTTLTFDEPITYIVGPNGAGKTTIAEAILWSLTGRFARGLDGGGRGATMLVTDGADKLRVATQLRDVGQVKRIVDSAGQTRVAIEGVTTSGDPQAVLFDRLGTTPAFLHAVCSSNAFLDHDHTAGKAFLMDLLDVHVPIGAEQLTLAELQERHKRAYDERTGLNRQIKEQRIPEKPADAPVETAELEALTAKLQELRDEARLLGEQGAEARGRRRALVDEHAKLIAERDTLQVRIAADADVHDLLDANEAATQAIAPPVAPALESPHPAIDEVKGKLVDARGRLTVLTDGQASIKGRDPKKGCVLDPAIPCLTPAKEFTGRTTKLTADIRKLEADIEELSGRLKVLETSADAQQAAVATYNAQLAATSRACETLASERRSLQARLRNRQADEERLTDVLARLAHLQTEISNLGDEGEEPAALATLFERIRNGEQQIQRARALLAQWTAYQQAVDRGAELRRELAKVEADVEQLGPKGAMVAAIAGAKTHFIQLVNGRLQHFGYVLDIEIEPWRVRVNGRDARRLSTSERLRVGLCLQLAFAELTGLEFVIFDNTEWLVDAQIRATFGELLFDWVEAKDGRQAIVIKALEEAPPSRPGSVQVIQLALVNGATHVLEGVAA